jgi:hypothetical protein
MSFLPANLRLFARFPVFIRTSRMNTTTTTTSNKPNQVPVPTRSNYKLWRTGALIAVVVGFVALFRASRKEEQLIEHSAYAPDEPPVAVKAK